mmetsp:Transcript_2639/g.3837  ORF Transcript_2639/g.3837 Transcript_2639/m.3837 type:complete len:266 (+) Transcript_2639:250-1047(+)
MGEDGKDEMSNMEMKVSKHGSIYEQQSTERQPTPSTLNYELVVPVDEDSMLEAAYGTSSMDHDTYSTNSTENSENYDATNMSMIGRRNRLSLSSNKIHTRNCGYNHGHSGVKRQSTASAYMLAYVRESDLLWVLSDADPNSTVVDTVEKKEKSGLMTTEEQSKDSFSMEYSGLHEIPIDLKIKLGMDIGYIHNTGVDPHTKQLEASASVYHTTRVTIPYISDKEIAAFDSLEGAYVTQFTRSRSKKVVTVEILMTLPCETRRHVH